MKKYNINIEENVLKSITIEADTIEEAIDKAKEIYTSEPDNFLSDYGTDPQIMAEAEDNSELTDWHEF